ncbi:MAG TPA: PKD domain-containing protein [Bacteroidia bacterium]|nr:PKD domain-containing protein [Bacteroidia bacterium]
MKTTRYILIAVVAACAVLYSGCKKEEVPSGSGSPVFYATGTMDGAAFTIKAGVDHYYMFSSFASNTADLYTFSGSLHRENCAAPCPSGLSVYVNDYAVHTSQQTNINTALQPGMYNFSLPAISGNTIQFFAEPEGDTGYTYSWDFGDSQTSQLENPSHTYATGGLHTVCLTITGLSTSTVSMFCDTLYVGTSPCMNGDFETDPFGLLDSIIFIPTVTGGTAPYTWFWNFGDGFTATTDTAYHRYFSAGVRTARVVITDNNLCSIIVRRNVKTPSFQSCVSNFTWQTGSSTDFSAVIVEWTDSTGNIYTSADPQQPGSSTFEIISVSDYEINQQQQRTKKVHMRVNCTLYNGANSILLENTDIVFAIAYP